MIDYISYDYIYVKCLEEEDRLVFAWRWGIVSGKAVWDLEWRI